MCEAQSGGKGPGLAGWCGDGTCGSAGLCFLHAVICCCCSQPVVFRHILAELLVFSGCRVAPLALRLPVRRLLGLGPLVHSHRDHCCSNGAG